MYYDNKKMRIIAITIYSHNNKSLKTIIIKFQYYYSIVF